MKSPPRSLLRLSRRLLTFLPANLLPTALLHWLGARAIAVAPEQIAIREGMRAGVAVGSVMLLAWRLEAPLMAWAAFAAFWTCLVDPGGPLRQRIHALLRFSLSGMLITGLISAAAGWGLVPGFVALGLCIALCGLSRMGGTIATQISVLAAIVAVVAVCYPQSPMGAMQLAGLFAAGAAWAMLICILAWPVDPFAPQKQACTAIFRELAHMAGRLPRVAMVQARPPASGAHHIISAYRRDIRTRIEQARAALALLPANAQPRITLSAATETADRLFAAVMALEHAAFSHPPTQAARRVIRLLTLTLQRVAREIPATPPRADRLARDIALLRRASMGEDDIHTRAAIFCADALQALQAAWNTVDTPQSDETEPRTLQPASAATHAAAERGQHTTTQHAAATPARPQTDIRREAAPPTRPASRWPDMLFIRHAARLAVAVLAAYAISLALNLPYAYWAMMAVVVVTQPSVTSTLPRAIERVAGSMAGGFVAALMGVFLPQYAILLLIFPLAAATIALRSVNYALCVMFMSQLFVLVTDLVSTTHGWDVALSRAANNTIGSLVGLVACVFLWPGKRPAPLAELVCSAFTANLRYAALAACPPRATWHTLEPARRAAGTASSQAEILYQQKRLEGLHESENVKACGEILFLLRQLAGAASIWWLEQPGADSPDTPPQPRAAILADLAGHYAHQQSLLPQDMLTALRQPALMEIQDNT
ncbi:MAG: FUSC family protein [Acetobacter papayae]